jgi:hypothetical protein
LNTIEAFESGGFNYKIVTLGYSEVEVTISDPEKSMLSDQLITQQQNHKDPFGL